MKQKTILFFFILYSLSSVAQKTDSIIRQEQLVGFWQINSSKMSNAFGKSFQFFPDGRYVLNFDSYDDTKRVLSLAGHYKLEKHRLFMTVESRKEIVGGDFTKGSPGFQSDEFVLEGGKVEVISQKDSSGSDPFLISICNITKLGKITCIKIDNNKYYKLSSNPNQFDSHK